MDIRRGFDPGPDRREEMITHCLDALEDADGFSGDLDWKSEIVPSVTLEELIGAAVVGEQANEDVLESRKEPW